MQSLNLKVTKIKSNRIQYGLNIATYGGRHTGEKDEHRAEFFTPLSQKLCLGIFVSGLVYFLHSVKL